MGPFSWRNMVASGGEWDYKSMDFIYMPYGNFAYGGTGSEWFNLHILQLNAGAVSDDPWNQWGSPGESLFDLGFFYYGGGSELYPYGDSFFDQELIQMGHGFSQDRFYQLNKRPCTDAEYEIFLNSP